MCKLLGDLISERYFKKKYNVIVKWMGVDKSKTEDEEEKKTPHFNPVVSVPQWAYKVSPGDANWA